MRTVCVLWILTTKCGQTINGNFLKANRHIFATSWLINAPIFKKLLSKIRHSVFCDSNVIICQVHFGVPVWNLSAESVCGSKHLSYLKKERKKLPPWLACSALQELNWSWFKTGLWKKGLNVVVGEGLLRSMLSWGEVACLKIMCFSLCSPQEV